MDSYNRLVRRSVDNLMQADSALGRQEAQQAVSRQIRDRRTGGRAPGHGEHNTRPVTIVNDICDGVTVDCTGQESNSVRSVHCVSSVLRAVRRLTCRLKWDS